MDVKRVELVWPKDLVDTIDLLADGRPRSVWLRHVVEREVDRVFTVRSKPPPESPAIEGQGQAVEGRAALSSPLVPKRQGHLPTCRCPVCKPPK